MTVVESGCVEEERNVFMWSGVLCLREFNFRQKFRESLKVKNEK
jgi:hypothetical protein